MKLAFKVDVDTFDGTRVGVKNLSNLFCKYEIPATFFFSLGKDQMGRSIFRIFKRDFLKKCLKSKVISNYRLRTLLSGTIIPAPVIADKCNSVMRYVADRGFECGVHCLNHYKWQNFLNNMSAEEVHREFFLACKKFKEVFCTNPVSSASAGWQVSAEYFKVLDERNFLYGSDVRGFYPFYPRIDGEVFNTVQIPTTLYTLDEILVSHKLDDIIPMQMNSINSKEISIMTIHAELEGMAYLEWFELFLKKLIKENVEFFFLKDYVQSLKKNSKNIPVCDVEMSEFFNRSGLLAIQK